MRDSVERYVRLTGILPTNVADDEPPILSLNAYGATSPFDDAGAAMAAALQNVPSSGATIVIPAGSYTWSTVPKLPRDLTGMLRIVGLAGAKITLTATGPRLFDFDRTADYQTFRNIEISDLEIDGGGVGGSSHVIVGTYIAGAQQQRMNLDRIAVRRIRCTNVPVSGQDRRHIAFHTLHLGSGETQTNHTNITVEDCHLEGGICGVLVIGRNSGGSDANIYHDNIVVRNVRHDMLTAPSGFVASAHVHVGSEGFGDGLLVENIWGSGSRDVGIEIDGMSNVLVQNVYVENCNGASILIKNFRAPPTDKAQKVTIRDATFRKTAGSSQGDACSAIWLQSANSIPIGDVTIEGVRYYRNTASWVNFEGECLRVNDESGNGCLIKSLTVRDVVSVNEGISQDMTVAYTPTVMHLYVGGTGALTPLLLKDIHIRCSGAVTNAAASMQWNGISLGGDHVLDADSITMDYNVSGTASGTCRAFNIGAMTGSVIRGTIRRYKVTQLAGDANPRAIFVRFTTALTIPTEIKVVDSDFSKMTAGTEVSIDSTQTTKVTLIGNRWFTYPVAPSTISPTGSPFTYQNLDGYSETVTVSGGTVSAIDIAPDGTTFTATGLTSGAFLLDNVTAIRVTYTGAPTMKKYPQKS